MNVKPISITQPLIQIEGKTPTPEELIVYCARVSNPSNQANLDTAPKLIKYCLKNKHFSIFETVHMTVEIETSRAIAAQLLRHRSFTFQEFSQRYAEADLGFEVYEARGQDHKNRQNSLDNLGSDTKQEFVWSQQRIQAFCKHLYEKALEAGVAKEQARFLLPLSTTTRLYMTGSVRSWIHYLEARTHRSTQKEHRDVAYEIHGIFRKQFPVVSAAMEEKWRDDYAMAHEAERAKELEKENVRLREEVAYLAKSAQDIMKEAEKEAKRADEQAARIKKAEADYAELKAMLDDLEEP